MSVELDVVTVPVSPALAALEEVVAERWAHELNELGPGEREVVLWVDHRLDAVYDRLLIYGD